ncbi:DEKNAAC104596 [Brettanomyces naardenensis]|uniref:DEKNAAC104596 n=1 Tax=Brettanomyces naardenensis TaxID=13370 RepID=A0A448YRD2_BRENA|nr:DEKNAAC104596 [Brettanomyces naardenensis]
MSEYIDTAFVKAVSAMRAVSLWTTDNSLPRPPSADRVKLYGLYKQATEGDMAGSMKCPMGDSAEDEVARRRWIAWKKEEGLTMTEAKKRYVAYLIETMKTYAGDSKESRDLLADLEYMWNQIRDNNGVFPPARSQSPAVSLYRVVSGGFNSNIVRPPSRNLSNSNTNKQVNSIDDSDASAYYYNQGLKNTDKTVERSMEFIRWQSEINHTLNRISHELDALHKGNGMSHQRDHQSIEGVKDDPAGKKPWGESSFSEILTHIGVLATVVAEKLFRAAKTVLGHAAADTAVLLLIYGVLRALKLSNGLELIRRIRQRLTLRQRKAFTVG